MKEANAHMGFMESKDPTDTSEYETHHQILEQVERRNP